MDRESLLQSSRGAIMAEGVIVLPVFVIILAAVIYFHRAYAAKIDVNTQARSCAWSYAVNGCKPSAFPKGCPITELPSGAATIAQVFRPDIVDDVSKDSNTKIVRATDNLGKALEKGGAISRALLGLGEGIVAKPSRSIPKPSILGGGTRAISGDYTVMCNETKKEPIDLAKGAYCAVSSKLPGCPL